jgi:ankyrin repeat protein
MSQAPVSHPTRRLPPQPSLEQLRKQAKDLLEQYRTGAAAARAEVEQFELAPDPAKFALNDAQRILARAYGYASWPKLKAFVDGTNVQELAAAVQRGDASKVRVLLNARPELIGMDMAENNEHRALHYAVLRRDPAMVRLLMEAGADARKGIYPHRDATSALTIARERGYQDVVAVIEEEERLRREEMSCPNATVSPVQDQINAAISEGDNATAVRLLEEDGSLIQACDNGGGTPLHTAAEEGNAEMVAWLLERRAKVNKQDVHGFTALDRAALAAGSSFPLIAELLMAQGAEISVHAAVALADAPRIRALIQADPAMLRQVRNNGGLLALAVRYGHLEVVRLLLDLGADVDERVMLEQLEEPVLSWGHPLWHAARENEIEIARLLLDRGADPNANVYASGWPLGNAWNHEGGVLKNLLLSRGAKMQPYMVSATHNVEEARRLLKENPSQDLAHELAWSACDHGCPEIVELALPHLKWPHDDHRWHWIIIQPPRGASSDPSKNEGHFKSMAVLLKHGIDPNVSRYGQTVLHFTAAYSGGVSDSDRARFAAMLIDHGAKLDVRDDLLKSTPLGWACRWGRTKLAELLISRGASVDEPDAEAWATPKAWAEKLERIDIIELLRRPGPQIRS